MIFRFAGNILSIIKYNYKTAVGEFMFYKYEYLSKYTYEVLFNGSKQLYNKIRINFFFSNRYLKNTATASLDNITII